MKGGSNDIMSLYVLSEEEYSRLYYNLFQLFRQGKLTMEAWEQDFKDCQGLKCYKSRDEFLRVKVYNFVKRLYLFNQLAVMTFYDFRKSGKFKRVLCVLNESFKHRKRMNKAALHKLLGSVHYNCVDNNGYNFMGTSDCETMKDIRGQLTVE